MGRRIITLVLTIRPSVPRMTRARDAGTGPLGYPGSAEVVKHAPAGLTDRSGCAGATLPGRRPAVRHFRLPLHPECITGSGCRRRLGLAPNRRSDPRRFARRHGECAALGRRIGPATAGHWKRREATNFRLARLPGRSCSGKTCRSCRQAPCSNRRSNIRDWPRAPAYPGIAIDSMDDGGVRRADKSTGRLGHSHRR